MRTDVKLSTLDRRVFLVSAVAGTGLLPHFALSETVLGLERSELFKDDFAKIVGNAKPVDGKITIDLPEIAENGNFVPITIVVDNPMTEADHVKTIHVLSTANPFARVATFRLSPLNGFARVQSRMRLAKTQDVVTLAELSTGEMLIATTLVKVTIGGCAG